MRADLPYQWLADLVLALHFAVVAFVVGGLGLIIVGNLRRWRWVNHLWLRLAHLAAIAVVVAQSWLGVACPLTQLEMGLRAKARMSTYSGSFIEHWLQRALYFEAPSWVFVLGYSVFGLLVVATWWRFPPSSERGSRRGQGVAAVQPTPEESAMSSRATGSFEVKLLPQPLADADADAALGRMSIDKTFSGDLQATSKGEMLMAGTAVKGSAGYVAIERVSGTLQGRSGSFVLQHMGTLNRGAPQLIVSVVPDSGSGELTGLTGTLAIDITDGQHLYAFDYVLPAGTFGVSR